MFSKSVSEWRTRHQLVKFCSKFTAETNFATYWYLFLVQSAWLFRLSGEVLVVEDRGLGFEYQTREIPPTLGLGSTYVIPLPVDQGL